ncbi:unnamed protein product [Brassicogethes aeneus]|uniref:Uncharacterized protein n=1 Tax=Brassicogethes aeneus TaxID=1431903 RepID=A0A9P0B6D4_BRAAE|nr:unnamed protein product [Brassicogethes aeneus]
MESEDPLRNPNNTLEDVASELSQRVQFYQEENARMESLFSKLLLLNDNLEFDCSIERTAKDLAKIAINNDTTSINPTVILLSQADKLRKRSKYCSKLKMCNKLYVNLNVKLTEQINYLKNECSESKEKVNSILSLSNNELLKLREKTKKYEHELHKMDKNCPWLKNPEFDLLAISKDMDTLTNLRLKKDELLKELEVYQGLKPDLKVAINQLEQVRLENVELTNKLFNYHK